MGFMDRLKDGKKAKCEKYCPMFKTAWAWWVENWKPVVYPLGIIISALALYYRYLRE
jgi:hypothetical protein